MLKRIQADGHDKLSWFCHLLMSLDVLPNSARNNASQLHRNRITDHTSDCFELYAFTRRNEFIMCGEALKQSSFPQRQPSILFGVAEPTVSKAVELCRDCWCWFRPFHTPVDSPRSCSGWPNRPFPKP